MNHDRPIIFFDGICNLCNKFADIIITADKNHNFYLASLQGKMAQNTLPKSDLKQLNSIILKDASGLHYKSTAIFKIARSLGGLYLLIMPFWILPRFVTNFLYDLVASRRYRFFGKRETCRIPTESELKHFLD